MYPVPSAVSRIQMAQIKNENKVKEAVNDPQK